MELKDQVCTQEQSHRLYELGVRAESIFYYRLRNVPREFWNLEMPGSVPHSWQAPQDEYHAYNASEIGEMLPLYLVDIGELTLKKNYRRDRLTGWNVRYEKTVNCNGQELPVFCGETQAEALALMLIYLLENKLLNPS